MNGLLSLLLFAAFFYLMMRFGCGAHMVHGNHGGHEGHGGMGTQEGSAKDPVCGMPVEPGQGYTKNHKAECCISALGSAWTSLRLSRSDIFRREENLDETLSFIGSGGTRYQFIPGDHVRSVCLLRSDVSGARMYQSWQNLLPGFHWISWRSFFLGVIESYGYGWYVTLIWVPLYNVFAARGNR